MENQSAIDNKTKNANVAKIIMNCLKYGKHYFLAYDEQDEMLVIENLLKYTNSFIVLKTDYIELFDKKNAVHYHFNDIKLDSLFSEYNTIDSYYADKNKMPYNSKNKSFLYFYMIPDITNIIQVEYLKYYFINIGKMMIESMSKYCVFDDEVIFDKLVILKFSKTKSENKNDRKFLFNHGGMGDFYIAYPVLSDYLANTDCKDIYLLNQQNTRGYERMANLCYGDKLKIINPDGNIYLYEHWLHNNRDASLLEGLMLGNIEHEADTLVSLLKKCLLGEKELDHYKHNHILKENILKEVPDEEKDYIEQLVQNKNKINIGLQYFTGIFSDNDGKWIFLGDRKWNPDNLRGLVKKCRDNNINLIILNSETYDPSLEEFCTKKLSNEGYALLISKMDLVVGVDSSAGHIASFYNIPSITLWGQSSPLVFYDNKAHVGYRALRKNYSIIAKDRNISSIDYNTVYSFVEKFIRNELSFKEDIITYQDSLNDYNICYV